MVDHQYHCQLEWDLHHQFDDNDHHDNHHQLKWNLREQCETEQSRPRKRINRGFHWRYNQVIIVIIVKMMMVMITSNKD